MNFVYNLFSWSHDREFWEKKEKIRKLWIDHCLSISALPSPQFANFLTRLRLCLPPAFQIALPPLTRHVGSRILGYSLAVLSNLFSCFFTGFFGWPPGVLPLDQTLYDARSGSSCRFFSFGLWCVRHFSNGRFHQVAQYVKCFRLFDSRLFLWRCLSVAVIVFVTSSFTSLRQPQCTQVVFHYCVR